MKKCEYCSKEFTPRDKQQVGRFCSSLCNRKVLRKNQLKKREEFLKSETAEEKMKALKKQYEKFVIKNENDCWSWNGSTSSGYGNFAFRGKVIKAHRTSWILHNGTIPDGLWVLHRCDVRICSRPDHLFLGNNEDNMKDMAKKGRAGTRLGSNNSASVLSEEKVKEIRKLLKLGVPMPRIAQDFGVSKSTIGAIKYKYTWTWVD